MMMATDAVRHAIDRLRDETAVLTLRSQSLQRLAVSTDAVGDAVVEAVDARARNLVHPRPLTVAIAGPPSSGKSSLLGRIMSSLCDGSIGIDVLAKARTDTDLLLLHRESQRLYSPVAAEPLGGDLSDQDSRGGMALVCHSLSALSNLAFLDTAPYGDNVAMSHPSSRFQLQSVDRTDSSIHSIKLPMVDFSVVRDQTAKLSTIENLQQRLKDTTVDVFILAIRHADLDGSLLSSAEAQYLLFNSAAIPALVLTHTEDLTAAVREATWDRIKNAFGEAASKMLSCFFTSKNDVVAISQFIKKLLEERQSLISITTSTTLDGLLMRYNRIVQRISDDLEASRSFIDDCLATVFDVLNGARSRAWELEEAILSAFEAAIVDIGLDQPCNDTSDPRWMEVNDPNPDANLIRRLYSSSSDASAALRLSQISRREDPSLSNRLLMTAAGNGYVRAMLELARLLETQSDATAAVRWHVKAASKEHVEATVALARAHLCGIGIESNPKKAVTLLRRAVAAGSVEAGYLLAWCLENGVGTAKSLAEVTTVMSATESRATERCEKVIRRVIDMFGSGRLKSPYALKAFIDRLQDQIQTRVTIVRLRLSADVKARLTTAAIGTGVDKNFSTFRSLILDEIARMLEFWAIAEPESEEDLPQHALPLSIATIIRAVTPGLANASALATLTTIIYARTVMVSQPPITSIVAMASPFSKSRLVNLLISTLDSTPQVTPDAIKELRREFASAWTFSIDSLCDGVEDGFGLVIDSIDSNVEIFKPRIAWSRDVFKSLRDAATMQREDVSATLVAAARTLAAADLVKLQEQKGKGKVIEAPSVSTSKKSLIAAPRNDRVIDFNRMAFVWEGAQVIMFSHMVDEVSGSITLNTWDWELAPATDSASSRIDVLLDEAATVFSTSASQSIAMKKWEEVGALAKANGDLIAEANALSNMGCAARMWGSTTPSLAYLESAWRLTAMHVMSSYRASSSDKGMNLVMASLDNELTMNGPIERAPANARLWPSISPSTLTWITRLLINLGHTNLAMGDFGKAAVWYDAAIRLCDNTLNKLPVTSSLLKSNPPPKPQLIHTVRSLLLSLIRAMLHRGIASTDYAQGYALLLESQAVLSTNMEILGDTAKTSRYRAAIEASMGNISHARGRLSDAIGHHARAAMFYLHADESKSHARELANLGALWCEVGKTLRGNEVIVRDSVFAGVLGISETKDTTAFFTSKRSWRPVTAADLVPDKVFRVTKNFEGDGDLDIRLRAGDQVQVIFAMEDGTTVLGHKVHDGQQGTFPLKVLEMEDESSAKSVSPMEKKVGSSTSYAEILETLRRPLVASGSGGLVGDGGADLFSNDQHCGMPYVELGLGMLRDVVDLGFGKDEVTVNIAVCEIMLNQPFRAMATLARLVDGQQRPSIPPALHKNVVLVLSSAYLMVALASEGGRGLYNMDGTERFQDSGVVEIHLLNVLHEVLGVHDCSLKDIGGITRQIGMRLAQLVATPSMTRAFTSGVYIGKNIRVPLEVTAKAVYSCCEWIEGLWSANPSSSDALIKMNRGAERLLEAIDNCVATLGIHKSSLETAMGDSGILNMAISMLRIESSEISGSPSSSLRSGTPSLLGSVRDGSGHTPDISELTVWAWAVGNTRLAVCGKCAPAALVLATVGSNADGAGGVDETEVFPCEHLRNKQQSQSTLVSSRVRSSEASKNKGGGIMSDAGDEVYGAMVRRVTKQKVERRSSIAKAPWNPPRQPTLHFAPSEDAEEGDIVETLKSLLKSVEASGGDATEIKRRIEATVGEKRVVRGPIKRASYIDMFYRDATDAVKRSTERIEGRGVVKEGQEDTELGELPRYSSRPGLA